MRRMNARTFSLVLLAVNLGLAATLAYMLYSMQATGRDVVSTRMQYVTNSVTQIAVRKINATNTLLAAMAARATSWMALESTNYVVYIQNLRAFGCPEETVRDIIITDIAKLYGRRKAALRWQAQGDKFWLPKEVAETTQYRQQLRAIEQEQRELVKSLLGVDLRRELARYTGEEAYQLANIAFLPAEKQSAVTEVQEMYADLEQDIYFRSHGVFLDEDQEAIKRLQRERDAELAKTLTPEELFEYQLRNSDTANSLRASLGGLNPSQEEFRKLFAVQKTFDDQFNAAFNPADENSLDIRGRAQQEAQAALDAETQKALGPERFAEYQRAQDGDYRTLRQMTERFNLPSETANAAYDMKLAAERQKQLVELNPGLTEAQRSAMLAAIANETGRGIAGLMGDDVYKAYHRNGGQWIDGLSTTDIPLSELQPPPALQLAYPPLPPLPPDLQNFLLRGRVPENPVGGVGK